MQNKRLVWFVMMIALGLAGGLVYGWLINPVEYVDTSADSLHPGYKADYVLMVAEIYHMDSDLPGAIQRLALLGPLSAERIVADGMLTARSAGYAQADLDLIQALSKALQEMIPGAQDDLMETPALFETATNGAQP